MGDSDEEYERRRRDKFRRERPEIGRGDDRRSGGAGGAWGGDDRSAPRDNWGGGYNKDGGSGGYNKGQTGGGYKNYRGDYGGSRDAGRRGYSPNRHDMNQPQMKRPRRDWEEGGSYGGGGGGGSFGGEQGFHGGHGGGGGGPGGGGSGGHWSNDTAGPGTNTGTTSFGNTAQRSGDNDFPTQPAMMMFKHFLAQQDDNITDDEAIKKYNEYKREFRRTQLNEFFLAHKEEE